MTKETMAIKQKKRVKCSRNRYLRPGALAQLCHSKSSSKPCTDIGKKRIVLGTKKAKMDILPQKELTGNVVPIQSPVGIPSMLIVGESDATRQNQLPKTPKTPPTGEYDSQSRLESLPLELLVKILCYLHHDQVRAVFHVSQRIRTAVLVAQHYHFNYTTPDRARQEMLRMKTLLPAEHWPFVSKDHWECFMASSPDAPKAPKHGPRCARAHPIDITQIAAVLFQESTLPKAEVSPGSPLLSCKALTSNRVLFCEDELCHAVAQNKLR